MLPFDVALHRLLRQVVPDLRIYFWGYEAIAVFRPIVSFEFGLLDIWVEFGFEPAFDNLSEFILDFVTQFFLQNLVHSQ